MQRIEAGMTPMHGLSGPDPGIHGDGTAASMAACKHGLANRQSLRARNPVAATVKPWHAVLSRVLADGRRGHGVVGLSDVAAGPAPNAL